MKEKHILLAGNEFVVKMDDRRADRIARNWAYRRAIRPALRWMERGRVTNIVPGIGREPAANFGQDLFGLPEDVPVFYPRPTSLPEETSEQDAASKVRNHEWYHTLLVADGVLTPGLYDHAPALRHFPIPEDLSGKRCLDVATFDGFWAFEMERRGAAEVVALDIERWDDIDLPPYAIDDLRGQGKLGPTGSGFQIAAELLGSHVKRRICNVYDLSPDRVGRFDLVFCGDLLLHITNPLRALQNMYSVTRGALVLCETYAPGLDAAGLGPVAKLMGDMTGGLWWLLSKSYLQHAIQLAGFARVEYCGTVDIRPRRGLQHAIPRAIFRAFTHPLPEGQHP